MLRHTLAVTVLVASVAVAPKAEAADPTAQAFVDTVALGSIAASSAGRAMKRLDSKELERKFDAAEGRLRQLGVSKKEAELWSGDTAFKPIEDELDTVFERLVPDNTDGSLFDEAL